MAGEALTQLTLDWGQDEPGVQDLSPMAGVLPVYRHPLANREIQLSTCAVAYHFTLARRRSIGLRVTEDGLEVRAPRYCLLADVQRVLQERGAWIHEQLRRQQERRARVREARIVWAEGGEVPVLGQTLILKRRQAGAVGQPVSTDSETPGVLWLSLPPQASEAQVRDAVQAWLKRWAHAHFSARLDHFAQVLGVRWLGLKLSSAKSRWGSADQRGQIRLNWRLIHASPALVDYVVVHELSHLREMNHSARFWDVVAEVMPDYRRRVSALNAWTAPPVEA